MKKYELMFILSPNLTEDEVNTEAKKTIDQISKLGIEVGQIVDLGKKKLAYAIKKQRHGYYQLVEFSSEGSVLKEVNDTLRLDQTVLRHLITEKPEKSPEQIEKEQALRAKLAAKRQQNDNDSKIRDTKTKTDETLSPEELDKKLSKILEDTPSA
jgi:small subunit ribosomal protein S6